MSALVECSVLYTCVNVTIMIQILLKVKVIEN